MDEFWPTIVGAFLAAVFGMVTSVALRLKEDKGRYLQARAAISLELENRFAGFKAIEWGKHDYLTIPRLIRVIETSQAFERYGHELEKLPAKIHSGLHEHYAHSREIIAVVRDMWMQVAHADALQLAQGLPQTAYLNQGGLSSLTDELDAVFKDLRPILEHLRKEA